MSKHSISAAATGLPVDRQILEAYRQWLHYEGRMCGMELYPEMGTSGERLIPETFASEFHFPPERGWRDVPKPSSRAELVLRAVGVLPEPGAATPAEAAALEFEPWEHTADEWTPPSDAEWVRLANPYLVTIRLAWMILYKTKPEVMKIVDKIDDDTGRQMMDGFVTTIDFFKGVLAILETAEARILCAGSAVIVRDEEAAGMERVAS